MNAMYATPITRADPPLLSVAGSSGTFQVTSLPATVNLSLYAGDDFMMSITVNDDSDPPQPFDLSEAVAESHIRVTPQDINLAGEFSCTTEGNVIYMNLDSATSAALPSQAVWDVQVNINGRITTLAAGSITMTPEVTR